MAHVHVAAACTGGQGRTSLVRCESRDGTLAVSNRMLRETSREYSRYASCAVKMRVAPAACMERSMRSTASPIARCVARGAIHDLGLPLHRHIVYVTYGYVMHG